MDGEIVSLETQSHQQVKRMAGQLTVTVFIAIIAINPTVSSSGTCFLSSYQLPSSSPDTNSVGHPSQFFGQNDGQQKITDQQAVKGGRPTSGTSGLRGLEPTGTVGTTTTTTPIPFRPPGRVNYLRPASRTGGTRPLIQSPQGQSQLIQSPQGQSQLIQSPQGQSPLIQSPQGQLRQVTQYVNAEELETIALFEAALERAQKDFGSRINSVDSRSFTSSLTGRVPLPKSPPRKRPQQHFPSRDNHATNFFNLDFDDFSQERVSTVDHDYSFRKTTQRRTSEQNIIELPPPPPPATNRPSTTTVNPIPLVSNRGKTSEVGPEPVGQRREVGSKRGIESTFSSFDSRLDSRSPVRRQTSMRFMSWLEKARMLRNMEIVPGVNFTVLLPSDSAVESLPLQFRNELESNMTKLRQVLFYHIIPLSIQMISLQDGQTLPTLYSKSIRVTRITNDPVVSISGSNDPVVSMSGSKILNERTDMSLEEGKVRFFNVDKVLFPPKGSLYSIISTTPDLSIFRKIIDGSGLRSELAFNGPFTLFAPSNEAFNKLDSEAMAFLTADPKNGRDFVLRHISKPLLFTATIPASASTPLQTAFGENINVLRVADDLVQVDGVPVTFADIFATNGVLHVLDQVL